MNEPRLSLQQHIVAKAVDDPQFRHALIGNARAAIEREFGVALPPALSVRVYVEDPQNLYLLVASDPPSDRAPGDAELAGARGGWNPSAAGACYTGPAIC